MSKHEKKTNAAIENFSQGVEAGVYLGQNIVAEKVGDILSHSLALFDLGLSRYGVALIAELAEETSEILTRSQMPDHPLCDNDHVEEGCEKFSDGGANKCCSGCQ